MAELTVRYFASARAAAGVAEELVAANTVAEALSAIRDRHDDRFGKILDLSSLLLDGQALHDPYIDLAAPALLDVLPPFAGG